MMCSQDLLNAVITWNVGIAIQGYMQIWYAAGMQHKSKRQHIGKHNFAICTAYTGNNLYPCWWYFVFNNGILLQFIHHKSAYWRQKLVFTIDRAHRSWNGGSFHLKSIKPFCCTVILLFCMPFGTSVILTFCLSAVLWFWNSVFLTFCYSACHSALLPSTILVYCDSGILLFWHLSGIYLVFLSFKVCIAGLPVEIYGGREGPCHCAILPYRHTAILPYCHTAIPPYCHYAHALSCAWLYTVAC